MKRGHLRERKTNGCGFISLLQQMGVLNRISYPAWNAARLLAQGRNQEAINR